MDAASRSELARIEVELSRDRALERSLRLMRLTWRRRGWQLLCGTRPLVVLALAALSVAVLVAALVPAVAAPALVWLFAALWMLTLVTTFAVLCRVTEDRHGPMR